MGYGAAIGAVMGGLKAASKGTGKNVLEQIVKYPEVANRLPAQFSQYDATKSANQNSFDDWLNSWTADLKNARALANQEKAGVGSYWNLSSGLRPEDLAWLTRLGGVTRTATDLGNAAFTKRSNLDQIMGGGGGSSYLDRLKLGGYTALENQNLLNQLNAEAALRANNERVQLGTVGTRQAIEDAHANRLLQPAAQQRANFGWDQSALASFIPILDSAYISGVKYKPSGFERGVNIASGVLEGAAAGYAGGQMGGATGGGMGALMGGMGAGAGTSGGAGASPSGVNWMSGWGGGASALPSSSNWLPAVPTSQLPIPPAYPASGWYPAVPTSQLAIPPAYGVSDITAPPGGWGGMTDWGLISGF